MLLEILVEGVKDYIDNDQLTVCLNIFPGKLLIETFAKTIIEITV